MILDLFGYVKRNYVKWNRREKEKLYREAKNIVRMLEKELNY